jgi:CRISPR/Cas system CSM-associated protein Csm3 (group 7 of RAMP superfamily)
VTLAIHLTLQSDATFGRGDGVAGLVDAEVEHDATTGLPLIRGRTLKGLLVEECANVLYALRHGNPGVCARFEPAARFLFGRPGSTLNDDALMQVGAALLPKDLREAVASDIKGNRLTSTDVLESLTAIRRQTAVDEETGAPDAGSLRSMRVVLRGTTFVARLGFDGEPDVDTLALLAASVLALRRGGTGRNRGRGRLKAELCDGHGVPITATHFTHFQRVVKGGSP